MDVCVWGGGALKVSPFSVELVVTLLNVPTSSTLKRARAQNLLYSTTRFALTQ